MIPQQQEGERVRGEKNGRSGSSSSSFVLGYAFSIQSLARKGTAGS
jgi:hypothetical protein